MRISFVLLAVFFVLNVSAQIPYKTLTGRISFTSVKGMVMLEAFSENLMLKYEPSKNEINLKVQMTSFNFTNCSRIVEKKFNDDYVESHKYHWAKFEGKIVDSLNVNKSGTYNVIADGKLSVHGIEKQRKINGTIIIKEDNSMVFNAKFPVQLSDHNIIIFTEDVDRLANVVEVSIDAEIKSK